MGSELAEKLGGVGSNKSLGGDWGTIKYILCFRYIILLTKLQPQLKSACHVHGDGVNIFFFELYIYYFERKGYGF